MQKRKRRSFLSTSLSPELLNALSHLKVTFGGGGWKRSLGVDPTMLIGHPRRRSPGISDDLSYAHSASSYVHCCTTTLRKASLTESPDEGSLDVASPSNFLLRREGDIGVTAVNRASVPSAFLASADW